MDAWSILEVAIIFYEKSIFLFIFFVLNTSSPFLLISSYRNFKFMRWLHSLFLMHYIPQTIGWQQIPADRQCSVSCHMPPGPCELSTHMEVLGLSPAHAFPLSSHNWARFLWWHPKVIHRLPGSHFSTPVASEHSTMLHISTSLNSFFWI